MRREGKIWGRCSVIWGLMVLASVSVPAFEMNSWTNSNGGKWEETNWSLGFLPGESQLVQIAAPMAPTVRIDAATARNYSSSLLMGHLVVSNANALFLDH